MFLLNIHRAAGLLPILSHLSITTDPRDKRHFLCLRELWKALSPDLWPDMHTADLNPCGM